MKRFFILFMAVTVIGLSATAAATDPPDNSNDISYCINEHSQDVTLTAYEAPGFLQAEAYPLQQIEAVYQCYLQPPGNVAMAVKETAYTNTHPSRDHWPSGDSKASCSSIDEFAYYYNTAPSQITSYLPGYSMARTCGTKLEVFKNTKAPCTVTASLG